MFGAKSASIATAPKPSVTAALMPKATDIRPKKTDIQWQPFRTKLRRQGNPFYTMGYSQDGGK